MNKISLICLTYEIMNLLGGNYYILQENQLISLLLMVQKKALNLKNKGKIGKNELDLF